MNMELDDLPPRYRAQAEQQLAARKRRAADPLAEAVKQAKAAGRDFDSRGEYEFYTGTVLPKMARGEIVECEQHPAFPLFPAGECRARGAGADRRAGGAESSACHSRQDRRRSRSPWGPAAFRSSRNTRRGRWPVRRGSWRPPMRHNRGRSRKPRRCWGRNGKRKNPG